MRGVYGSLEPDTELSIGDCRIRLEREGTSLKYIRECGGSRFERILHGVESVLLHPAPPLYLPVAGLFSHVYIPVSPSIYLHPGEGFETRIDVIPDLAVSPGSGGLRYIDIFSVSTPKMAVYGGADNGILSRYLHVYVGGDYPKLSIPIEILNEGDEAVTISKIVLPISYLDIYFKEGENYSETNKIHVRVGVGVAEVTKGDYEGYLKPIPRETTESLTSRLGLDLATVKKFLTVEDVFLMDRGL